MHEGWMDAWRMDKWMDGSSLLFLNMTTTAAAAGCGVILV